MLSIGVTAMAKDNIKSMGEYSLVTTRYSFNYATTPILKKAAR